MTRTVISMTIEDAAHYTPEQRAAIIASYPEHERDARTRGVPVMGSGRVFPIAEERITCAPFAIPEHWPQLNGLDFGYDHPFAAMNTAWDRESDCFYLCKEYRQKEATPVIHAAAIKPWGEWVPCAWPHDGLQHDKGSGSALRDQYAAQGLKMLAERATSPDGGFGVEAAVLEMLDRMQTDRLKVFSTCGGWLGEFRLYHRKDGIIQKLRDDLISAGRYALMMRRFAQTKPRARTQRHFIKSWMG